MLRKSALILAVLLGAAGCREAGTNADGHAEPAASSAGAKTESAQGHDHAHGDSDKAAQSLRLNNGAKWQTDAPLRTGMTNIRNQLQAAVKPIHAKSYSPDDYKGLAGGIEKEIGTIVQSCKLPKEVDDQLHLVLAQITAGTELMKKDGDRMAGAVKVIQGLESYEKFFEHPDWKPLEH